jgi:hypothetical protein
VTREGGVLPLESVFGRATSESWWRGFGGDPNRGEQIIARKPQPGRAPTLARPASRRRRACKPPNRPPTPTYPRVPPPRRRSPQPRSSRRSRVSAPPGCRGRSKVYCRAASIFEAVVSGRPIAPHPECAAPCRVAEAKAAPSTSPRSEASPLPYPALTVFAARGLGQS